MAYSRTRYGTGYYIYHQYDRGAKMSQPIAAWDGKTPPGKDVLDLIARAGSDLAPISDTADTTKFGINAHTGVVALPAAGAILVSELANAPSEIRALEFDVPREKALDFGRASLRITWDGRAHASIDAPLALFFGAGILYNRDNREYLVKAFPVYIRYEKERVKLACFFPMPFFKSAKIELIGAGAAIEDIHWNVRSQTCREPANHLAYFHATYRDHAAPEPGKDLVLLDTREAEGSALWSGSFVGTSFIFSDRAALGTLEGDPRFFFDDSQTPQAQGTGTEEWGGGGDYWGGQTMTLPFAGHPCGAKGPNDAKSDEDKIESAYRFLLADLMPFGRTARIQLEHGGVNESTEHYRTVAYWYGSPGATLRPADSLQIGDAASEKAHAYNSPQASEPYEIVSRYEWGPDTARAGGASFVVYPPHTDRGRITAGVSEFTLKLDPKNVGAMLRRKLDYAFPNKRADVFVADASAEKAIAETDWKPAGVWYLAGSNTCVYSNPPGELGATQHLPQTSNRRFRDDEFLVPRDLTEGRSAIRVRIKFTPVPTPLFPGHPVPELAWSEIRYDLYCFVAP